MVTETATLEWVTEVTFHQTKNLQNLYHPIKKVKLVNPFY